MTLDQNQKALLRQHLGFELYCRINSLSIENTKNESEEEIKRKKQGLDDFIRLIEYLGFETNIDKTEIIPEYVNS